MTTLMYDGQRSKKIKFISLYIHIGHQQYLDFLKKLRKIKLPPSILFENPRDRSYGYGYGIVTS